MCFDLCSKKLKIRASKWIVVVVTVCTYLFFSLISHMQRHNQTQGWWRDYYKTRPRKGTAGSDAWATGKSQKYKMYSKECWIHHFAAIKDEQAQADLNGTVLEVTSSAWASTDDKTSSAQTSNRAL